MRTWGAQGKLWSMSAVLGWILGLWLAAAGTAAPPQVSYKGPTGRVTGPVTLMADAKANVGRIVAVTFFLDGRPLGSDTTKPYSLGLNPALVRPSRHRVRVVAVDNFGRRVSTRPVTVTTAAYRGSILRASPTERLDQALQALRRGDVMVRLAPGRYRLDGVRLGSGARLVGSGARTVISASNSQYWALLVAKGQHIRIANLALDGGGPGAGGGNAIAVFDGSRDVRMQRLRVSRVRKYGVNVWGKHSSVSVQDSQFDGGGTADAALFSLGSDDSSDTSVIRTRIRGFRDFGILLGQKAFGRPAAALHGLALDNDISDIRDPARDACTYKPSTPRCGTNEGGIWSGGVSAAIIGNKIRRARWDGIETVGSSTRTTIVHNDVRGTRTGIYIEHSTNDSLISKNLLADVDTGINVEWRYGGVGSKSNSYSFNRIASARKAGVFIGVGSDDNRIVGNTFLDGLRPAIVLQGSSENTVRGNRGCGTDGDLVQEVSAKRDDGSVAKPRGNRMVANRNASACRRR
ncbi:MAG TPA: right-handed parallel beta-helix repeat-containing protein [Gaiellaceae bacterium]